ncbi:MAG: DUF3987 domain-containing protein [Methanosarcina sp.]
MGLTSDNLLLDAAHNYLSRGWRVIPTVKKIPCVAYKEAGLDRIVPGHPDFEETFLTLFERHPEAEGIALILTEDDCVLDLDSPRAEDEFRNIVVNAVGIKTARGSKFLFTRAPYFNSIDSPITLLHCSGGCHKFKIRDDAEIILGGMLCELPPGLHKNGTFRYEWIKGPDSGISRTKLNFADPFSEIPDVIFSEICSHGDTLRNEQRGFAPGELEELLQGVAEGEGRNTAAIRIAGHYIGKNTAWVDIELLLEGWNRKNRPPMSRKEMDGILQSAKKMYTEKQEAESKKQTLSGYRTVSDSELEEIKNTHDTLRLNLDLPDDHFVTQFVEWSDSLNDGYREYKIITAFWLLSALVQQKVYSRWSTGTIYPNVWTFLIGPSTISRKTTVIDNGRDIYISATGNKIPDTDYSLEGYAESLVETPVLNCVRDEVSTLLSKMGQKYNDGYFEFECSMYDGKSYVKTLASKGKGQPQTFVVENTYITKLYATTPVKLASSMSTRAFDSGFGFRFLYACPSYSRELKGHRKLTDEDTKKWASIMERTRNIYNIFKEAPLIAFEIDDDAEIFYSEKTLEILNKLANEEFCNETLLAVWGRLEAYIIKLAMLIEIGKPQISLKISLDSLLIAFSMVCNYFVPSTISVYNQLLEDTKFNNIEKIIAELRKMRGVATHKELLNRCKLVAKDFNECVETMNESEAIEIVIAKSKNNKEAKTYLLKDENVNIVPKEVFNLERIISTFQIPQGRQVPQVLRVSNEEDSSENLETLNNFNELDRTLNNTNIKEEDQESIECAIPQSNNSQGLQIFSLGSNVSYPENLGTLADLRNLRSMKVSDIHDVKVTENPEDVLEFLEKEGF